jgi:hypothetical protein
MMRLRTGILALGCCLTIVVGCTVIAGRSSAQGSAGPCPNLTFEALAHMDWCELESLYRAAAPGPLPCGYAAGRAVYRPGERLSGTKNRLTAAVWHGKHFLPDGTLVNQWAGFQAIRARVSCGPSWLDGGPSIIMDYGETSHVWSDVRDEARQVAPGLYIGLMYQRRCPQPTLKTYFLLQFQPSCGQPGCAACGTR